MEDVFEIYEIVANIETANIIENRFVINQTQLILTNIDKLNKVILKKRFSNMYFLETPFYANMNTFL